jgi:L-aspartate oxidase
MRRFIYSGDLSALPVKTCDVLIVGAGIAGLFAALHVDPALRCTVVTKTDLEHSSSWLAQGGIAGVVAPDDDVESHVADTLTAGAGLCDEAAVRMLVAESTGCIKELCELSVPFDVNAEGELQITREGGHHRRRIVHCGGDATGRETTRRLGEIALGRKNVDVLFRTYLVDILTRGGEAAGAVVCGDDGPYIIAAGSVILATGGIGVLYRYTTNPAGAVGDGIAAAQRAGAEVSMMEMVQFHPTTLFVPQKSERLFLISEAVRGEGGILRNRAGEAFMRNAHPLSDLAPRDIVTRCILKELDRTGDENCFLDVSGMDEEFFARRFPTIFAQCRSFGINVPFDPIPVRPAQHYLMGGIKTGLDAQTSLPGLYACGECACTGVHGANRLASNSMLECLVFGRRAALSACATAERRKASSAAASSIDRDGLIVAEPLSFDESKFAREVKDIMTAYANAVRRRADLERGAAQLCEMLAWLDRAGLGSQAAWRAYNMAQTALTVFEGAIERTESVGAHYLAG